MNVEFVTTDGEKGRYTEVSYFQQARDEVGFFNDDDLGFVLADTFVTYAGSGHTGNVPTANEESVEAMIADLRKEEQTTDRMVIGGSFAYSPQDSSKEKTRDISSTDDHTGQSPDSETTEVVISADTALTALTEIDIAINQTGGPDNAEEACSPLALARQKIEKSDALDEDTRKHVIDLFHEVSDERGVELSTADPLVDSTFQAKHELESALQRLSDDG